MNEALQAIMSLLQGYGQQGEGDLPWNAAGGGIPGGVLPGGQWPAQGGQPQQGPGPGSYDDQTFGLLMKMIEYMTRQQYPPGAFSRGGTEASPWPVSRGAVHPHGTEGGDQWEAQNMSGGQLGPGMIGPLQRGAPPIPYNPTAPWQYQMSHGPTSSQLPWAIHSR